LSYYRHRGFWAGDIFRKKKKKKKKKNSKKRKIEKYFCAKMKLR
jgi:hypothetical protein